MKRIQIIKIVLCFFILLMMSVARGQTNPSDGLLILYKFNSNQTNAIRGKYVLCFNYDSPKEGKTSFVVIGDTFSVESREKMCLVTMTNTDVLQTHYDLSKSNKPAQIKMWSDGYLLSFPEHTKVIFNNSIVELSKLKIEPPADVEKPAGHQKQK